MTSEKLIEPTTRVAAFLQDHPQLEDELIAFAPPFKKLKNPFLRNSIGKVATLRQAAAVARVPVADLVNHLRALVGQPAFESDAADEDYLTERPDWFDPARIVVTIDEREEDPNQTQMAIVRVVDQAKDLSEGEILELVTTFLPAPGIAVLRRKGFRTWCQESEDGVVHTYGCRA